jgi:single-strand DNA-binding protein
MIIIQIAGHLGADPETRFTPSGQKVTSLRVATNIRRGGKEKTIWWKVTLWGDRFDRKLAYLKKGSAVFVIGEMGIPEIYNDREGNPQVSYEIIADHIGFNPFGSKDKPAQEGENSEIDDQGGQSHVTIGAHRNKTAPALGALDDDVPF